MRLFHVSDDNHLEVLMPRPTIRAVDEWHCAMHLFPRGCPRIFAWPVETTTPEYRAAYQKMTSCRMVAHIELAWLDRMSTTTLYRYDIAPEGFEPVGDAGMWTSSSPTMPLDVTRIDHLEKALSEAGVELRVLPSLATLEPLWSTSLHVTGMDLADART